MSQTSPLMNAATLAYPCRAARPCAAPATALGTMHARGISFRILPQHPFHPLKYCLKHPQHAQQRRAPRARAGTAADSSVASSVDVSAAAPQVLAGKTAAVVGGGPAGMLCAAHLARLGAAVEVLERHDPEAVDKSKPPPAVWTIGLAAPAKKSMKAAGLNPEFDPKWKCAQHPPPPPFNSFWVRARRCSSPLGPCSHAEGRKKPDLPRLPQGRLITAATRRMVYALYTGRGEIGQYTIMFSIV